MKNLIFIFLLLNTLVFLQCSSSSNDQEVQSSVEKEEVPELGKIDIQVTGNEKAMPSFMEGLLLMHSFEYEDAADKFIEAQELDSSFVMAYWGEAMTHNHPLWRAQFTKDAQAALMKLAASKEERLALAKTEFEKELLMGAEILFGEGDKADRDLAYQNHMASLHEKYPDNHEVAAFYALSILGATKGGRDFEMYGKAANIVKGIISENSNHPGALHYLIHSYDDPDHAKLALSAANSYSKVAPDAGHALHMPSHIYIALGMWDEVISSNRVSYDASVERMKRKNLSNDARGYHAFKWLMYAHLQKGEFKTARDILREMKKYCYQKPSPRARSHFIQMRALYLTDTEDWSDPILTDTVSISDLNVAIKAVQRYTIGMGAYQAKDREALEGAINSLGMDLEDAKNAVLVKGGEMCSGVSYYNQLPNQQDLDRAQVTLHELKALLALMEGDNKLVVDEMEKAIALEDKTSFMFGPPEIVKPSHEMYAEYLLKQGKDEKAGQMFEKVLERAPKRRIPSEAIANLSK